MTTKNLIDRPIEQVTPAIAEQIFGETLSALGGYGLLQQTIGLRASYLCRGLEGELIMRFDGCDRASKVKIELCEVDMYAMTFYRFSFASVDRGCQVVGAFEGIDREQLQHVFEEFTELSLIPKTGENDSYSCTDVKGEEKN
jgi:hypothetical protein